MTITNYAPPTPAQLAQLKKALGRNSNQMADLAGLANGGHWRKYTGGSEPRALTKHMHFYLAAQLVLSPSDLERVAACMRRHGAGVDTDNLKGNARHEHESPRGQTNPTRD